MIDFVMPKDIESEAKQYMESVLQKLEGDGLLESVDTAALQMLARNYSTFIKASKTLKKDGLTITSDRGNISEHPCVKIAKDAQTLALKIMTEFGLTAKSRVKLVEKSEEPEDSPLAAFIKSDK